MAPAFSNAKLTETPGFAAPFCFIRARLPTRLRDGTQTGASNGGVWEWTSTNFEAWEGWRAAELYPDYSRDFFDGCHWVMLGGSFGEPAGQPCRVNAFACQLVRTYP